MKKILYILLMAVLPCSFVYAQDGRQRTPQTVVMDVLAQLPSADRAKFNQNMHDLAAAGKQSMEILGGMLKPADQGKNANLEYAISGLVAYVTSEGNRQYVTGVREGLRNAIEKCNFNVGKAFLISQLQLCAEKEDIALFVRYLDNQELSSPAMNAIINTPGSESAILELVKGRKASPVLLGYAVHEKMLTDAEPYLIDWLKEVQDEEGRRMLCAALGACGTVNSIKILSENSANDCLVLLKRLADNGEEKKAMAQAKKLLKHEASHIRTSAMEVIISIKKGDIRRELLAAMKGNDRAYRNAVLKYARPYMTEELYSTLSEKYDSYTADAKVDYINAIANNGAASRQVAFLIQTAEDGGEVAAAAIRALGKSANSNAADFLVSQLGGMYDNEAVHAILAMKCEVADKLIAVLDSKDDKAVISALGIISKRKVSKASGKVFGLLESDKENIRTASYKALSGVVTPDDAKRIAGMAGNTSQEYLPYLNNAFTASVSTLDNEKRFETVASLMKGSSQKEFYYPALAQTGTDKAAEMLIAEYKSGHEASLAELLKMNNKPVMDFMSDIIRNGKASQNEVVMHYLKLVRNASLPYHEKCQRYESVLSLNSTDAVKSEALSALSQIPLSKAFEMAGGFLKDKGVAYKAAATVKAIASNKLSIIDYKVLEPILKQAMQVYSDAGSADDGYAVDEIKKLLNELKPYDRFVLSDEEKKQGFEILFDGTDLSKWEGDTLGYRAVNGAISVSADYGNAHNLYTKKQYRDFVFRFEFCFKTPGVNNGVGIRTPKNVDAAYGAMCEVQILDHDHPAYSNIAPYQVHGSVYGVIPAKRIVHKPHGEWSTEEIRVQGDHITVTVNGEVILDGNVREACQGHNVAPDGGNRNPYTIDHNNHPGMFNKKGHISFCGHGAGIMLRNIRILNLDK